MLASCRTDLPQSVEIWWGTDDPKVCKSYDVQVIQNLQILSGTSDTKVRCSYELGFIQKCADLMRDRWYKTVRTLWGPGHTKVCSSYEFGFIQMCAHLMRYRWYKSVRNLRATGDRKVRRSYEVTRRPPTSSSLGNKPHLQRSRRFGQPGTTQLLCDFDMVVRQWTTFAQGRLSTERVKTDK